ncbi:hypothetical protein [Deinococcus sonorensis]|uniref:DUF4412 domain-containing protein n=2 Tax=Deinococcus sonorensis TaxID=309891 RepID=A0AAU7U4R0_9DEIO
MRRTTLLTCAALLGAPAVAAPTAPSWEQVFGDVQGPLHLKATYQGRQGQAQPLEFWRAASGQVVRRTGGRAELRLIPAADGEDLYQLRNLQKRTAFLVHRVNLYRVGIFTDRWGVQHLLDRPVSGAAVQDLKRGSVVAGQACHWWRIQPAGQAAQQVCWAARLGVPLQLKAAGHTLLTVTAVQRSAQPWPSSQLPQGWQEFNADEDIAPD